LGDGPGPDGSTECTDRIRDEQTPSTWGIRCARRPGDVSLGHIREIVSGH